MKQIIFALIILIGLSINMASAAVHTVNVSCTAGFDLDGDGSYEVSLNATSKTIAAGDTLNLTYNNCQGSFSSSYIGQEAAPYTEYCGSFSPTPPTGYPVPSNFSLSYTAATVPTGGKEPSYCTSGVSGNGDHIQYENGDTGGLSPQLTIFVTDMVTVDTTNPTLFSSTPADNATGVAVNADIVLTFDEAVDVETGNITIYKTSGNTLVETIAVGSSLVTGTGTATITINPASDLAESTEYYILIAAAAFDDPSSNSYAGISSTTALSFTTISTALPNPLEDKEVLGFIKAQTDTVVRVAGQSMRSVNGRLTQLISAPRDSLANNSHQGIRLSMADTNLNDVLSSTSLMSGLNSSADIFNNGWAIWTEGSLVLGKGRGNSDFNTGGITVGVDKRITPMLTTGIALRAAQEDNDVGIASSIDTNSYSVTAYESYALNNSSYIQGALGYSDINISSKRVSNADIFKGSRDAEQVYMSLSLTKQFDYMGLTLLPYGSFDGSYSTLDSYSETGSNLALTYHKQHIKTLAATLGLRGNYMIQQSYGLFVPRFHVNYQGDINSDSNVAVNYVSIPSTTYKTSLDGIPSSSWLLGLGFDYQRNNLNFSADYERTEQINWGHIDTFRLMLNAKF